MLTDAELRLLVMWNAWTVNFLWLADYLHKMLVNQVNSPAVRAIQRLGIVPSNCGRKVPDYYHTLGHPDHGAGGAMATRVGAKPSNPTLYAARHY